MSNIKEIRFVGRPGKSEASVESIGLPSNPLGYGMLLIQGGKGSKFTLVGDAEFVEASKGLDMSKMTAMSGDGQRRFYYMRDGWPDEFQNPSDTTAWKTLGSN